MVTCSATAAAASPRAPGWAQQFLTPVLVLGAITSIVISQRIDAALTSITSIREVGGDAVADGSHGSNLPISYLITGAVGIAALGGVLFLWRDWLPNAAAWLARVVLVGWGAAVLLGWFLLKQQTSGWTFASGGDAGMRTARAALAVVGVLMLLRGIYLLGERYGVSPGAFWKRASVIRVQLCALLLLVILIYALPMTSAQAIDVLRAWADTSLTRVFSAVAAAVVLGAVIRDSCTSFLAAAGTTPTNGRSNSGSTEPPTTRASFARLGLALVLLLVGAYLAQKTHWVVALVVLLVFALALITMDAGGAPATLSEADPKRLLMLARWLACVPLAVVFVGVTIAATDSFLLPGPAQTGDYWLLAYSISIAFILLSLILHAEGLFELPLPRSTTVRRVIPAIMCALVAGVGIAPSAFPGQPWSAAFVAGALLVVAGYLGVATESGDGGRLEIWAGVGAVAGTFVAVYTEPVRGSDSVGTFGLTMFALTGVLLCFHGAAHVAARRAPLPMLARVFPERIPIVTVVAVWVIAAFAWGPDEAHQARTVTQPTRTSAAALAAPASLDQAVDAWLDSRLDEKPRPARVNMALIAAAGGGEKVAFWTDLVLDCAFANPGRDSDNVCEGSSAQAGAATFARPDRIFLTSSVSGGSVGIYRYLKSLDQIRSGDHWPGDTDQAWSKGPDQVPTEVLSPIAGWGFFHDLPLFMLGLPTNPVKCKSSWSCRVQADRAAVQEEAVEEPYEASDGQSDWFAGPASIATAPSTIDGEHGAPVAVFNSAIDGGVGRLLIAPFKLARAYDASGTCEPLSETADGAEVPVVPGALDIHDLLQRGQQMPLVTAALLTARFPVVAPAARVGTTRDSGTRLAGCRATPPLPDVRARDGGYVENTGLLTIVDLLPSIRREARAWMRKNHHPFALRYVVASIDDDAATLVPQLELKQQSAGPTGIAARASSDYLTRLARDELASGTYADLTYLRISPPPTIGAHAATGWELSSTTRRRHLVNALTKHLSATTQSVAYQLLDEFRCLLADGAPSRCMPSST
jgi:hypothetical protein